MSILLLSNQEDSGYRENPFLGFTDTKKIQKQERKCDYSK